MNRLIRITGIVLTIISLTVITSAVAQLAGSHTLEEFFLAVVGLPFLGIVPLIASIFMIRYSVRSAAGRENCQYQTATTGVPQTKRGSSRLERGMKASLFAFGVASVWSGLGLGAGMTGGFLSEDFARTVLHDSAPRHLLAFTFMAISLCVGGVLIALYAIAWKGPEDRGSNRGPSKKLDHLLRMSPSALLCLLLGVFCLWSGAFTSFRFIIGLESPAEQVISLSPIKNVVIFGIFQVVTGFLISRKAWKGTSWLRRYRRNPLIDWFSVYRSIPRLVLMQVATFGLYQFAWFHRNWTHLYEEEKVEVNPNCRTMALFFPICNVALVYEQFTFIHRLAVQDAVNQRWTPKVLTAWYALCYGAAVLLLIGWVTTFLSPGVAGSGAVLAWICCGLPLAAAQETLNGITAKRAAGIELISEFRDAEETYMTFGLYAWLVILTWSLFD